MAYTVFGSFSFPHFQRRKIRHKALYWLYRLIILQMNLSFFVGTKYLARILTIVTFELTVFCDSKQEADEFSTRMRDFVRKYSVNNVRI